MPLPAAISALSTVKAIVWPWGVIAVLSIAVGVQQVRISDRDATIAERDVKLADQKTEMERREKDRAVAVSKETNEALGRYKATIEAAATSLEESRRKNASAVKALDAAIREARNAKESLGCVDAPGIAPVLDSLRERQRSAR